MVNNQEVWQGKTAAPKGPYKQAKRCFEIIKESLARIDIPISKIVRTRMFVTDISLWKEFGRAHKEFFKEFTPVTSMIEIKNLIDPEMFIKIEAVAYI